LKTKGYSEVERKDKVRRNTDKEGINKKSRDSKVED
jgi:hypothetical protein